MASIDWSRIVPAMTPPTPGVRVRFGTVVSVDAGATLTVTISGASTAVSGVRYLDSVTPTAGDPVVFLTDGVDLFVLGTLAA